ncbi:MAG: SPFH domain-containing protein [Puniceicoccaceae bacterium]
MFVIKTNYIPHGHVGLKFRDGRFVALLAPGTHVQAGISRKVKVYKAWQGQPWMELPVDALKQLRDSELLKNLATFVDLADNQRALVWLDGRFHGILIPGLYGFWTTIVDVRIEIFDTRDIHFEHAEADVILQHDDAKRYLNVWDISQNTGGIVYVDGQAQDILGPGRHGYWKNGSIVRLAQFDLPWLAIEDSDLIQLRESGEINDIVEFVDVMDNQRALVWFNGRFSGILGAGLYAYWKEGFDARIELVEIGKPQFIYDELDIILKHVDAGRFLNVLEIADGKVGVLYQDGDFDQLLQPGRYAFWKDVGQVNVYTYDLREQVLDVTGQEIMTADKVTLRMNAVLTYRITDVRKVAETASDVEQVLYRELQLIIRAEVGGRTLDQLLADKVGVANGALTAVKQKADSYGIEIMGLGIRDVILPGDMKELLNQVIEAEKAAQANNIKRREETAAMRSQLNSAKLIEQNPILMRLRELESVEKFADKASLQIFVGDGQGMADRIVKLI